MTDARTFTVAEDDDGIRLDRWFKRHMPEVSFNMVSRWARTGQLRLSGKRAVPGDRDRGGAGNPRSAARDRAGARRAGAAEARSADRGRRAVRPRHGDPPGSARLRAQQAAGARDAGRDQDDPASRPAARRPRRTKRGRPKLVHRLDKDTSGALAGGAERARGGPFRQGLFRAHGAQGLLGAGRRRARRRRGR